MKMREFIIKRVKHWSYLADKEDMQLALQLAVRDYTFLLDMGFHCHEQCHLDKKNQMGMENLIKNQDQYICQTVQFYSSKVMKITTW